MRQVMKRHCALIAAACLLAGGVHAAERWKLIRTEAGGIWAADLNSIKHFTTNGGSRGGYAITCLYAVIGKHCDPLYLTRVEFDCRGRYLYLAWFNSESRFLRFSGDVPPDYSAIGAVEAIVCGDRHE
jgi:hypothetical protein